MGQNELIKWGRVLLIIPLISLILPSLILGQKPSGSHPSYNIVNIQPNSFSPYGAGGLDWMSDGRLVYAEWGGTNVPGDHVTHGGNASTDGKVHLLSGASDQARGSITVETVASNLPEPMGVKVVEDTIYVATKPALYKVFKDGNSWKSEMVYDNFRKQDPYYWHSWSFGLEYFDKHFWWAVGSHLYPPLAPNTTDPSSFVKYNPATNTHTSFATGLRAPNGLGMGPGAQFFVSDNQGEWKPANQLIHIREDAFYGHQYPSFDPSNGKNISKPAVWIEQNAAGASPSQPLFITKGTYAGQMLMGDQRRRGLNRYFLEKIGDNWQGAVFDFSQGISPNDFAPNRMTFADDGETLIVGSAGHDWVGGASSGLVRFEPTGTVAFEMLAVRSLSSSNLEIEFTKPANAAAGNAGSYDIESWRNGPTQGYGAGNHLNRSNPSVSTVSLSPDGLKANLTVNGLQTDRVLFITINGIQSRTGENPFTTEARYTLNSFGPGQTPDMSNVGCMDPGACNFAQTATSPCARCCLFTTCASPVVERVQPKASILYSQGILNISIDTDNWELEIRDIKGNVVQRDNMEERFANISKLPVGIYMVNVNYHNGSASKRVIVY